MEEGKPASMNFKCETSGQADCNKEHKFGNFYPQNPARCDRRKYKLLAYNPTASKKIVVSDNDAISYVGRCSLCVWAYS